MEVGGGGIGRGRFRTQRRGETCSALGEEVVRAVVERGGNGGVGTVREGGGRGYIIISRLAGGVWSQGEDTREVRRMRMD